jgi:hypothetical protein
MSSKLIDEFLGCNRQGKIVISKLHLLYVIMETPSYAAKIGPVKHEALHQRDIAGDFR